MKKKSIIAAVFALVAAWGFSSQAQVEIERKTSVYNLESGVALKGYDPVSYFNEGGGRPQQGVASFRLNYMGVTYFFASAANLDLFVQNPDKYEPTYGGWCAFAMASGSKVDVVPTIYTINGNRLHLFFSQRAKGKFDADVTGFEMNADKHWKSISGEGPRR